MGIILNHVIRTNLKDLVDKYKVGQNSKEYICLCPECIENDNHSNDNLYIKKDLKVGFCHRCKSKFINSNSLYDSSTDLVTPEFHYDISPFTIDSVGGEYYNSASELSDDNLEYLRYRYSKDKFDSDVEKFDKKKLSYVIPKHNLSESNLKGRLNKIIIPFYWENELIYYQVRNYGDSFTNKYYMPPIDHKPIYCSPFNNDSNNIGIICEGAFGALATSFKCDFKYNTYAIQGSYITDYQKWMIDNLGLDKLVLYFDEFDISLNILKSLLSHNYNRYVNTEIISSYYGDPETDYLCMWNPEIHDINWRYHKRLYWNVGES